MKYLTLLSAVFLPLAFVVGFFGQTSRACRACRTGWNHAP
jgi:hypothetical protein